MNNENFKELVDMFKIVNQMEQREIEESSQLVEDIILYQYKDERIISDVFDKMLSIAFASEEDIKYIYYKLLNYTKEFDKELAKDYEEIFIEHFTELYDGEVEMHK